MMQKELALNGLAGSRRLWLLRRQRLVSLHYRILKLPCIWIVRGRLLLIAQHQCVALKQRFGDQLWRVRGKARVLLESFLNRLLFVLGQNLHTLLLCC